MQLTEHQKQIVTLYGKHFNNTGGHGIVELAERRGLSYNTNPIVCELQGAMWAQIHLIEQLIKEGLLAL